MQAFVEGTAGNLDCIVRVIREALDDSVDALGLEIELIVVQPTDSLA